MAATTSARPADACEDADVVMPLTSSSKKRLLFARNGTLCKWILPLAFHVLLLALVFVLILPIKAAWFPIPLKIVLVVILAARLCWICMPQLVEPPGRCPLQGNPATASDPEAPSGAFSECSTSFLLRTQAPYQVPLLVALTPVLTWLALFSSARQYLALWLPTVDTTTLPSIDTALVGKPANLYFDQPESKTVAADVFAWLLYGVWHYVSAGVCLASLAYWGCMRYRASQQILQREGLAPTWSIMLNGQSENFFTGATTETDAGQNLHSATQGSTAILRQSREHPSGCEELQSSSHSRHTQRNHRYSCLLINAPSTYATLNVVSPKLQRRMRGIARRMRHLDAAIVLGKAFLTVFGCVNLAGVMIQYIFPTAPPWYLAKYGTVVPENPAAIRGDAAGLSRIDELFGMNFYANLFASNPLVFGAFPSLHSGFAVCIALFVCDTFPQKLVSTGFLMRPLWLARKALSACFPSWRVKSQKCHDEPLLPLSTIPRTCAGHVVPNSLELNGAPSSSQSKNSLAIPTWPFGVLYALSIWWATMYLSHHYLVDLLGGALLTFAVYLPVRRRVYAVRHAKPRIAEAAAAVIAGTDAQSPLSPRSDVVEPARSAPLAFAAHSLVACETNGPSADNPLPEATQVSADTHLQLLPR